MIWEDDAPAGSRFRRVQQGVPRTGRTLPGMPLEMDDPDGEDLPRSKWGRQGAQSGHWYWPAGAPGRVFLALGALVLLVALGIVGDLSKIYLQRDSRFRIAGASQIQAVGLSEVTRAQLLPVFGEDIGRNVFFVPLNERRKQLEAIPWVQQATVMRLLPDQIHVDIVERKPVAFTRHGQQIGLVDASGVLLDMDPTAMAAHHYSFPVLTGIDAGDKPASRQARMAVYQRLISELDSNGRHNSEQLSEIDLTDPEDARILMPEQGTDILAHFGEDHFLERYQRYKDHIAEWRQQYPKLAGVDLRYDHQVVLEMASGVSHAQPNPGQADASAPVQSKPDETTASPAKPKPAAKATTDKSAHEKKSTGASAVKKTTAGASAKSKANAKKSKEGNSKTAAGKKHALKKTAAQKKAAAHSRMATLSKTAAHNKAKLKPSPATRPSAAEGQ